MHVLTFSQARADLKQTMDEVCRDQDYNGMQETLYLLSSSANAKRLRSSIEKLQSGKAVTHELSIDEHEVKATQQG
ncbi:Antitoxin YefM [compost metagenome]